MESDDSIITPLRIIDAGARWLDSAEGEEEMFEAEYIEGLGSVLLALGAKETNAMKMGRLLGQATGIHAIAAYEAGRYYGYVRDPEKMRSFDEILTYHSDKQELFYALYRFETAQIDRLIDLLQIPDRISHGYVLHFHDQDMYITYTHVYILFGLSICHYLLLFGSIYVPCLRSGVIDGRLAFLMTLHRMARAVCLDDLSAFYGESRDRIGRWTNYVMHHIYDRFGHCLTLSPELVNRHIRNWAYAVAAKQGFARPESGVNVAFETTRATQEALMMVP